MAEERLLPNLKTRLTLDSTELAKGAQSTDQLRASLARTGEGARAGGEQIKTGLITPLRVAGDVARVFAAKKIFDYTKAGFDEMKEAEVVTRQTANVIANLGPAAGVTTGQVADLSEAMLRQSGVDDELAASAANTALRLGVEGESLQRVVQDANDLSQSFGDINSDSELLAKALAKPESAAKLLKPAIGALTDEQSKSIAKFVEQGDKASAQNVILEAVESRVKGAAAAYGDTLSGAQDRARESGKNLSAELVSGAAPAMQLYADVTQFAVDELDKAPDSVKTVLGSVVLLGGGVASLVRPVGDVVRLYQAWRDRSEEVTGAVSALATAEQTEAAASAAGAASSASATATTVASTAVTNEAAIASARRAVTNEQLSFTDAEVAAALQARQLEELKAIVSNEALIIAEEERIAVEAASAAATEGNAAASAGMMGVLGPLGIAVAAAGIGYALLSSREDEGTARAKAMGSAISQLSDELGKLTAGGPGVEAALKASADALAASADGGDLFRDSLAAAGLTTGTFAAKVLEGKGAVASYVLTLNESGQISDAQTIVLAHQAEEMSRVAQTTIEADVAQGKLNQTDVDAAEAKSKNSDGSINYAAALDLLQPKIHDAEISHRDASGAVIDHKLSVDELRSSTDELTDAEQAELDQADAAAKAHEDFSGFIDELTSAMDRSYQKTLAATDANINYEASVDDLVKTLQGNSGAAGDLQDRSAEANRSLEDSASSAAEEQAKLEAMQADSATTADELARQQKRVADAQHDHERAAKSAESAQADLNAAIESGNFTLDITTERGRDNVKSLEATGQAIVDQIQLRFQETHSIEEAKAKGEEYVQNLRDQLEAAGFNKDQIAQMIDTMNLTPEDIDTIFSNNAVEQQIAVERYIKALDGIDPEKLTDIKALIDQGRFDEANKALDELGRGRVVDFSVNVHGGGQLTFTNTATGESFSEIDIAARNIPVRARGGPVVAGMPYIVGDAGVPELFVPDENGVIVPEVPSASSAAGGGVVQHITLEGEPSEFTLMRFRRIARDAAGDVVRELVS